MKLITLTLLVLAVGCGRSTAHLSPSTGASRADTSPNLPQHCNSAQMTSVPVHENIHDKSSPTFEYKAWVKHPTETNFPVIIYLPGGPGGVGIDPDRNHRFPVKWGAILTDPRGVGCNLHSGGRHPEKFYTTEATASDVVALISKLRLENYILYGVSYGTVLGTVVAKQIESAGLPEPLAVVHEGTLGHGFATSEESGEEYIHRWNAIRSTLPNAAQTALRQASPAGIAPEAWVKFLTRYLMIGTVSLEGRPTFHPLSVMLGSLSPEASAPQNESLKSAVADLLAEDVHTEEEMRLHRYVMCQELDAHEQAVGHEFVNGELVASRTPSHCPEGLTFSRYDSKDYSTPYRTFYFQGEHDPATTLPQARYHLKHNVRAHRTFITIEKGGHNPIGANLSYCAQNVWNSIAHKGEGLQEELAKCARTRTTIETIKAR